MAHSRCSTGNCYMNKRPNTQAGCWLDGDNLHRHALGELTAQSSHQWRREWECRRSCSLDPEQVWLCFLSHAQGPPGNQHHHLCPEVFPRILRNTTPGQGWGCGAGDHPSPLLRSPRAAASLTHPAPTGGPSPTCPSAVSSLRCGRHSWVSAPNTEINKVGQSHPDPSVLRFLLKGEEKTRL